MSVQVAEILRLASRAFAQAGMCAARREAETLLAGVLGCHPLEVYVTRALDPDQARLFAAWQADRLRGVPTEYLTGHVRFAGLDFLVTPETLIPRPETELVLDEAVARARELACAHEALRFADVGTGCGNLAISLTREFPSSRMLAIDRSFAALKIAHHNAVRLGVAERMVCMQGGGLTSVAPGYALHVVVANPPYIPSHALAQLPREVQQEPRMALDGGSDGCTWTARWLRAAATCLMPWGYAVMELGAGQAAQVRALVETLPALRLVEIQLDWNDIPRVLIVQRVHG